LIPTLMLNAPVPAAKKVLEKAGLKKDDIDVWEINEAFAVVAEKFIRDLDLDRDQGEHQRRRHAPWATRSARRVRSLSAPRSTSWSVRAVAMA
jgi:acetyl-CoA acetyltransferase